MPEAERRPAAPFTPATAPLTNPVQPAPEELVHPVPGGFNTRVETIRSLGHTAYRVGIVTASTIFAPPRQRRPLLPAGKHHSPNRRRIAASPDPIRPCAPPRTAPKRCSKQPAGTTGRTNRLQTRAVALAPVHFGIQFILKESPLFWRMKIIDYICTPFRIRDANILSTVRWPSG